MKTKALFGIFTVTAGLMTQVGSCFGATWEGTDDFSGNLAKWDTTYIHPGQPSDGFFLSNGHLQFIKTATTTNYGGSGVLIWPPSLPFNTNWVVTVDAHLKPLSVKDSVPVTDQDIRASLYVYESLLTFSSPSYKRVDSVLQNGDTGDYIRTYAGGGSTTPVIGGGWDFTLGVSFDSSSKTGTAFYYPTNQSSQLVVLGTVDMSGWTNMQIMLYGLSEYWAVGPGEDWLDSFKISGTANSPKLTVTCSGTNVVLKWPTNATGFNLKSTANLSPTAWGTVSPSPVVVNTNYVVTNTISGTRKFYRLSQ